MRTGVAPGNRIPHGNRTAARIAQRHRCSPAAKTGCPAELPFLTDRESATGPADESSPRRASGRDELLKSSRRRLLSDMAGITLFAAGFGIVYGLAARAAGFSP